MKHRLVFTFLPVVIVLWLAACSGSPTPAPAPTSTAVSAAISPTETATDAPPTAVPATPTTETAPTEVALTEEPLFPTPEVTATPTATLTPNTPEYALSIFEPAGDSPLFAGQETTFRGEIQPPTGEPITLTVTVGTFTIVSAQIVPDAAAGGWEFTTTLAQNISGPGMLTVALGDLAEAQQPIQLAFDSTAEAPYIALARPVQGETAVAGHAFFFQGDSNNLIDDAFTIGVLADDCSTFIAAQKISLSSGSWYGFVILPQNAERGPACAVAYTGEYGVGEWREAIVPIELRAFEDPQITLLSLANPGEIIFKVGSATNLFGLAVNVPDQMVDVELVLDSTSGSQLVATGKAFADQFGIWSIDLSVPDDAPNGPGLLTITSGSGEDYQEVRQFVTISP